MSELNGHVVGAVASFLPAEESVKREAETENDRIGKKKISKRKSQEAIAVQRWHEERKKQRRSCDQNRHSEGQPPYTSPIGLLNVFVRHTFAISGKISR